MLLAGVGYASYQYGINRGLTPTINDVDFGNDVVTPVNNSVTNSITNDVVAVDKLDQPNDSNDLSHIRNYDGTDYIKITAPTNGALVPNREYTVFGIVSPTATKMTVTASVVGYDHSEMAVDQNYVLKSWQPGDKSWSYKVSAGFGNVDAASPGSRFRVTAWFKDGTTLEARSEVTYVDAVAEMGKPVVYLYPTTTQKVSVNVAPTGGISYSEPAIGNGWQVTANPDGSLLDTTGKVWPYLFWEGFATTFVTPKEGFVVAKAEVGKFFDEKLATLGLNAKEIADFEEFWLPKMQDKPYYFVTFIPQTTFDSYAPLTVSPKPDTVIRVFFDYKGLDKPAKVTEQVLPETPARNGFTVVEWGGRIYR